MRRIRYLIAAPLLTGGALLALYGLLALLYGGEGRNPGPTYVTLFGHRHDAHLIGALSLVVGLAVVGAAGALMRRR
jgi:hypothetical protein